MRWSKVLTKCPNCGKERKVLADNGIPCSLLCKSCSAKKNGTKYAREHSGSSSPNWRGGIRRCREYIYLYKPDHPKAVRGYVKRAILVLEEKLGRYLRNGYDSHHKNEIKTDDRPENLEEKRHDRHTSLHDRKRL